ncbi:MAG: hypothetical protein JEZ07_09810 [Phycisphaerae bacterium]|nr:hypothetical protein [Phycisphaerae bacterium]
MFKSLFAIISNTFTETIRQPVYGVVIATALLLLIFTPSLSMFTMSDDDNLLKDIGLSTLMVAGLFLAVFASANVVSDEIEKKTVLTVVTKTVSRTNFVIGKFLGISVAVTLGLYFLFLTLMMMCRIGVMQTASHEVDTVVVTLGSIAIGISIVISLLGNYLYNWRFSSAATILATISATLVMIILTMLDSKWKFNAAENHLPWDLIIPGLLVWISSIILVALAVACAIRFNLVMTMTVCSIAFVLGAMIQYKLGPIISDGGIKAYFAWIAMAIVPSTSIFVVSEPLYTDQPVPMKYLIASGSYAACYIAAVLTIAVALFRKRELG